MARRTGLNEGVSLQDPLLDLLTAEEQLTMYARLKVGLLAHAVVVLCIALCYPCIHSACSMWLAQYRCSGNGITRMLPVTESVHIHVHWNALGTQPEM